MKTDGNIDGKNEAIRAAQLRAGAIASRERAESAAVAVLQMSIDLHAPQAEHSSPRAIARLMASSDDE